MSSSSTPTRRIGRREPRVSIVPEYAKTYGPGAAQLAESYAFPLMPWQRDVQDAWLARDEHDRPIAITIGLCVPRQNGKNYIIEIFELFVAVVLGWHVLHTAHEVKCLDVSTPILTGSGWKTMGDLTDSDLVYGADGKLASITAHPIQYGNPCFEIAFDDGQTVIADDGHRWGVWYKPQWGKPEYKVVTTLEMLNGGLFHERAMGVRTRRDYKWRVQLPEPFSGETKELPVDPWLLGAWIGDETASNGNITVCGDDLEWTQQKVESLGYKTRAVEDRRGNVYTLVVYGLMSQLREIDVLGNKHIPAEYMEASIEQRRSLLSGLMDTDGTTTNGQCHLGMKDEAMVSQILSLVRSLGYKATKHKVMARINGRDMGYFHRVQFRAHEGESPFSMPRKTARLPRRTRTSTRGSYNAIVGIKPVESRPVRCITVHNDSKLYQIGEGFVVTHNTAMKAFSRICSYFSGPTAKPELEGMVVSIRRTNGQECITLDNGGCIEFSARSTRAARGFDDIQVVVFDEAQELMPEQVDAIMATLSASSTGTRQIIYTGTPTPPTSPGTVFSKLRGEALRGRLQDCIWHEWGATELPPMTASFEDLIDLVYETNPSMGVTLDEKFTAQEFATQTIDGFARERLGWWVSIEHTNLIIKDDWDRCSTDDPPEMEDEKHAFGVKFATDGSSAALSIATKYPDGTNPHIELIDVRDGRSGVAWIADWIEGHKHMCSTVVIDGLYGRDVLVDALKGRIPKNAITCPTATDVATAASMLKERVDTHRVSWFAEQERLKSSALNAERRSIGNRGAWGFGGADPCPIESCSLALWGVTTTKRNARRKLRVR